MIPASTGQPRFTPAEEAALAENIELDVEIRRRVLMLYRSLDQVDHYELLGVARTADRKVIKRGYYELAAVFHPDKYFRKNLGSFKQRMEIVFGRLTQAHDALTNNDKRVEYDAYLEEKRRSRGIEELLADALAEIKRARETIEQEVGTEEAPPAARASLVPPASPLPVRSSPMPPASPLPARSSQMPPASPPPARSSQMPPAPSSGPTLSDAVRREVLAQRLRAGRSMHPSPSTFPPARASTPSTSDAMEALRRRYEERVERAKSVQARKYVAEGEAALAKGDAVAAANAFRVAHSLLPDDPDLALKSTDAQTQADKILSETYARQAHYEEKSGQWAEAARSWGRVCRTRPDDAKAHERAANALVKSDGDLHEASRLAQRACTLEPKNPYFRLTLANLYLAAGLALNARRELETAAQLAPHDVTIHATLKRVGKST